MTQGRSILLVDDEPESLVLLSSILTYAGYRTRLAGSGVRALASIAAGPPDLILLDVQMPDMDGIEVVRRIKTCENARIPVVLLHTGCEQKEASEGLRLGAIDLIRKPFQREEVLARVRNCMELERLRIELEERRRTERALRESETRLRNLANGAPAGIWWMGPDRRLSFNNKRASSFAGARFLEPCDEWTRHVHPQDVGHVHAKYSAAVESQRSFRIECRVRRANGKYRWVLHTGVPRFLNGVYSGHIGASVDITDLKRNHERSLVTSKLESLGVLAAGIAHDFNNLIGSIYGESDLALSEAPPNSPARERIERIQTIATRASEIVNLLTTYAGGHCNCAESVDLSLIVAEMLDLLRGSISSKARLDIGLSRDLPIRANATQIRQVVLNLIMNASESLRKGGGVVKVTTGRIHVSRSYCAEHLSDLPEGDYCRLVVSDTGCGIHPEVKGKLFDPFYTTKYIGRGLGLAVVHGILRSHGGAIRVSSTPGEGSTFEVLLPCGASSAEVRSKGAAAG